MAAITAARLRVIARPLTTKPIDSAIAEHPTYLLLLLILSPTPWLAQGAQRCSFTRYSRRACAGLRVRGILATMTATLVIDDDTALLASLQAAARLSKVELVTASSWEEGLVLFQILSPDLVIADYNLPGSQHGLRLLSRIRQLRPSVRLLLVSGYFDEADLEKVMGLGIVDRALTKGSATDTARALIEEARAAGQRAATPTDWVAYSKAYVASTSVSEEELQSLDALLTSKFEGPRG